ncbi:MAG: glycosyltransferase family 2 protein [Planctomycetales bacterium]|nr:glycosyltransferase family 2 protein [Planctomycetales bacterium]
MSNLRLSIHSEAAGAVEPDYFPEQLFPPVRAYSNSYLADTARGYARMAAKRVVIGGLARDLGGILDTTIARIERLGRLFADYRVVMYENDSEDGTRMRLQKWGVANKSVSLLTETLNNPVNDCDRSSGRARRMAYYRKQCHREICQRHGNYDYVILVDTDLEGGWSFDGVANSFGKNHWDFIGSNGLIYRRHRLDLNRTVYYDAWAYREDEEFSPLSTKAVHEITYERGEQLAPITSCFGGLGIYRMEAFRAGQYDCDIGDTEHVPFHRSMRAAGYDRTFLNPSQITLYGRRHRTFDKYAVGVCRLRDQLLGRNETTYYFEKGKTQLAEQLCERRRAA